MIGKRFKDIAKKHLSTVGTINPSSRFLVDRVVSYIRGKNIVEWGAGNGCVTRGILDYLYENHPDDGHLTAFELLNEFIPFLEDLKRVRNGSRLTVVNDDAAKLEAYVSDCDCLVSGLPLAIIRRKSKDKYEALLEQASRVPLFIQFQYNFISRNRYRKYFSDVRLRPEFRNFPPAYIYVCSNNSRAAPEIR
ncbi:MAG: hypothetical protein Q8N99_05325 [Nanoarchaeota archaeon]|nr:hypothetical protein [Nanoarchaeota archaeon]